MNRSAWGRWASLVLLAGVILGAGGAMAAYVVDRGANLAWDDADYVRRGLQLARGVEASGPLAFAKILAERPKPPWLTGWIAAVRLAVGRDHLGAVFVLATALPYTAVLALAAWAAWRLAGPTAAWLAVLATLASPMGLAFGAKVMVETFLALWLLAAAVAAARLIVRPTSRRAAWFGLAVGLAAITKLTIVLFLAGPLVYAVILGWRSGAVDHRRLRSLALAMAVPMLVVAGPWYAKNLKATFRFAVYSAQYDKVTAVEPGETTASRASRLPILAELVAGWPVLAVSPLAIAGLWRSRRGTEGSTERDVFVRLVGSSLGGAVLILMIPSYFDGRFLLPIWPSVAVLLSIGWQGLASWRFAPAWPIAAAAGLVVGVGLGADRLAREPRTTVYWGAGDLVDRLVADYRIKSLGNVGCLRDWNVCKTGLVNETRSRPEDCYVLNDLSKIDGEAFAARVQSVDAIVVIDHDAIPADFLAMSPGLNRAYSEIPDLIASGRFEPIELPPISGLPPMRVLIRRDRLAMR